MAELKTKPNKQSVKKYVDSIKDPVRQSDCKKLIVIMQKITNDKPIMWGKSLVGFGKMEMTYASGRKIDWLQVGFASRKNAISLYLTCDLDQYKDILKNLGKYKRGVGCLYINKLENIDIKILRKLIKKAAKNY